MQMTGIPFVDLGLLAQKVILEEKGETDPLKILEDVAFPYYQNATSMLFRTFATASPFFTIIPSTKRSENLANTIKTIRGLPKDQEPNKICDCKNKNKYFHLEVFTNRKTHAFGSISKGNFPLTGSLYETNMFRSCLSTKPTDDFNICTHCQIAINFLPFGLQKAHSGLLCFAHHRDPEILEILNKPIIKQHLNRMTYEKPEVPGHSFYKNILQYMNYLIDEGERGISFSVISFKNPNQPPQDIERLDIPSSVFDFYRYCKGTNSRLWLFHFFFLFTPERQKDKKGNVKALTNSQIKNTESKRNEKIIGLLKRRSITKQICEWSKNHFHKDLIPFFINYLRSVLMLRNEQIRLALTIADETWAWLVKRMPEKDGFVESAYTKKNLIDILEKIDREASFREWILDRGRDIPFLSPNRLQMIFQEDYQWKAIRDFILCRYYQKYHQSEGESEIPLGEYKDELEDEITE